MDRDKLSNVHREPAIDASHQVSVHLAKQFQRRRFFRNQPIRNKNCLWWPCLLTDRDEMSNLYREPSKDASYQVTVHLAKRFQIKRILTRCSVSQWAEPVSLTFHSALRKIGQSETRIACGGSCLVMDHNKMCTLEREPSIGASHQVSIHFGKAVSEKKIFRN